MAFNHLRPQPMNQLFWFAQVIDSQRDIITEDERLLAEA